MGLGGPRTRVTYRSYAREFSGTKVELIWDVIFFSFLALVVSVNL